MRGCCAVRNLAMNLASAKQLIADRGGIQIIVLAMRAFADDAVLQEKACGAMRNMASYAPNKRVIPRHGGINVLLRCLESHVATVSYGACCVCFVFFERDPVFCRVCSFAWCCPPFVPVFRLPAASRRAARCAI